MTQTLPRFTIRPADHRGGTAIGWLRSRHSFSFGRYYDPNNMGFRTLRVINDDVIAPGQGFGEHGHDNMEILTWVLRGAVRHGDSLGHDQVLRPSELQRMSAGSGIRHSEFNASREEPVHLLQIWIEPDRHNVTPAYDQRTFDASGRDNRWQTLASPDARDDSMAIHQDAVVRVADVRGGAAVDVTVHEGRHAYVHIATGRVRAGDTLLSAGDAITLEEPGRLPLEGVEPAQVLWFDLA
jgi:redox-sensitive bicupin YhaK (pirin superfamily)